MLVHVTEDHIDRGTTGNGEQCPIALAVSGEGCTAVQYEDTITIYWKETGEFVKVALPEEAKAFAEAFEAGDNVEPFEFLIDDTERETLRRKHYRSEGVVSVSQDE